MRILQISDTHLSVDHKHFAANANAISAAIGERKPDLIINTGDLAMNGCILAADLEFARDFHASLPAPVFSVPGNHDVGDRAEIRADQVLNDATVAQFRSIIGADRWTHDIPGWRLIGLNAMLFATGHAEEEAQFAWLENAVKTDAKVALFMHKPMFIDNSHEGPRGYWTVYPEPLRRLLDTLSRCDLKLVASGHLHIARELTLDGVTHIWGPASSFVCGDIQEDLGGERRIGLVDYTFEAHGFRHEFVFPGAAQDLQLDPHHDTIYPPERSDAA